jgi:hypothetical protein
MSLKRPQLLGLRFSRLTVISEAEPNKYGFNNWLCRCDCGKMIEVLGNSLQRGMTKSCGCLKIETAGRHSLTHGKSTTSEYKIWIQMKKRCYNKKHIGYHRWGGKGCRYSLGGRLNDAAFFIGQAHLMMERAWKICKPFMNPSTPQP